MNQTLLALPIALLACVLVRGADEQTFPGYVDSDLCAHLMLGPITDERTECSRNTYKQGSELVIARLTDYSVFEVNKPKMLKENLAAFVEATGETKEKDGRMKLTEVRSVSREAAMAGPGKEMVDVRLYQATGAQAKTVEKIRHELAMMPYLTEFDFVSFSFVQGHVILSGWTMRTTNRSTAENVVKRIEGVDRITNNIEMLPLGRNDMQIRQAARAALQRHLARYFWGSGSDIKIVVKNGDIILLGSVQSKADSDLANMQCNSVPLSFHVFNMLRVASAKNSKG